MNKLTLILTLFFSTMFASPVYADWEKVIDGVNGTFYVDFDGILKNGGYVYFWRLTDYLKPTPQGVSSHERYFQGDCEFFRWKGLSWRYYKQPMGEGRPHITDPTPDPEWSYPPPNTSGEELLKQACRRSGL
jgi:hypothetical protein